MRLSLVEYNGFPGMRESEQAGLLHERTPAFKAIGRAEKQGSLPGRWVGITGRRSPKKIASKLRCGHHVRKRIRLGGEDTMSLANDGFLLIFVVVAGRIIRYGPK